MQRLNSPLALALLLVAGCAYDPPMRGDHAAPKYRDALTQCRAEVDLAASRKANATPSSAFAALFASNEPQHRDIQTCMQRRGYSPG